MGQQHPVALPTNEVEQPPQLIAVSPATQIAQDFNVSYFILFKAHLCTSNFTPVSQIY